MRRWFTEYTGHPDNWDPKIHRYTGLFIKQLYVSRQLYGLVSSGVPGIEIGTGKTVLYDMKSKNKKLVLEVLRLSWLQISRADYVVFQENTDIRSMSPVLEYEIKLWIPDENGDPKDGQVSDGTLKLTFQGNFPLSRPIIDIYITNLFDPKKDTFKSASLCVLNGAGEWKPGHDVRRAIEAVVLRFQEKIEEWQVTVRRTEAVAERHDAAV